MKLKTEMHDHLERQRAESEGMVDNDTRCIATVYSRGLSFPRPRRCKRAATNGEHCSQHDPVTVAARKKASAERLLEKSALDARIRHAVRLHKAKARVAPPLAPIETEGGDAKQGSVAKGGRND